MEFSIKIIHGWYSEEQFRHYLTSKKNPYIYYLDIDNNIIQVTEISHSSEYTGNYNDVIYLGSLKTLHSTRPGPGIPDAEDKMESNSLFSCDSDGKLKPVRPGKWRICGNNCTLCN